MARGVFPLLILIGAWWSLLLVEWVEVSGEGLIGADLNQTMALLPAVGALSLLIALYKRLPGLLFGISAASIAGSSAIALMSDFANSPSVVEAKERVSGIAGGGEVAIELSAFSSIFGFAGLAIAAAVLSLIMLRAKPKSMEMAEEAPDSRDLWDEQS